MRLRLRRAGLRAGYRLLRVYWRVVQPHTRGVKCLVARDDGAFLLVRHTYGNRKLWRLPGGGVRRREEPLDAIRRELREELGLEVLELRLITTLAARVDAKQDTVYCFAARAASGQLRVDEGEIAEAGWFASDALPAPLERFVSPVVQRGFRPP